MSDFGELCPLFNSGVFREILFPYVRMSDATGVTDNFLFASTDAAASGSGYFTFGRTVVITKAYLRKQVIGDSAIVAILQHHTSIKAAGTVFASLTISITITGQTPYFAWIPMTVTDTTFTATDILGMAGASAIVSAGIFDLIVRYKDK
jgi:hypothetical protein